MIGKLLDQRYQVTEGLVQGGFGHTYLAEDTRRPGNPICVVKHLQPATNDPEFLQTARRLFNSEAETLEKLGIHDQIPRLLAYFEEDEEFYLVEEYISGHPLSAEFSAEQNWNEPQVVQFLQEVLPILEFVHRNGVIHRDIKPDNLIRRAADNKVVLVDFGAVKQVKMQTIMATEQFNNETVAIGTPGYMPSEQSQGRPRPSSDLYALGMVCIQSLSGLSPAQLPEDPETGEILWRQRTQVSELLAAVLSRMVRHYFRYRYQSAVEVSEALEPLTKPYSPKGLAVAMGQMGRHYFSNGYQFGKKAIAALSSTALYQPYSSLNQSSASPTSAKTIASADSSIHPSEKTITVAPGFSRPLGQANSPYRPVSFTISIDPKKLPGYIGIGVLAIIALIAIVNTRPPSPAAKIANQKTQPTSTTSPSAPQANQIAPPSPNLVTNPAIQPRTCRVVTNPSNVRSGAGGGRTGKVVPAGTLVTITGKDVNGWIEISAPVTGWVWGSRLQPGCPKP